MGWALRGKSVAYANVADAETAIAFYGGRLGLKMVSRDDFGMSFAFGGGLLRVTPMPGHVAGPHPVAGIEVADIEAAADGLAAAGVAFKIYDGMGQDARGIWAAPGGGAKIAWFEDPFGNLLSLSETAHG